MKAAFLDDLICLVEVQLFFVKSTKRNRKGVVDWIYLRIPETASKSPYTNGGRETSRRPFGFISAYFQGQTCCYSWKRDITSPDILFRVVVVQLKWAIPKRQDRQVCWISLKASRVSWVMQFVVELMCVILMGLNFYNYYFHFHGSFPETSGPEMMDCRSLVWFALFSIREQEIVPKKTVQSVLLVKFSKKKGTYSDAKTSSTQLSNVAPVQKGILKLMIPEINIIQTGTVLLIPWLVMYPGHQHQYHRIQGIKRSISNLILWLLLFNLFFALGMWQYINVLLKIHSLWRPSEGDKPLTWVFTVGTQLKRKLHSSKGFVYTVVYYISIS